MFLKTIKFVKTSNHAFKQTRCYNGCMQDKIQSDRFSHIYTYAGIFRHRQAYSKIIRHFQELLRDIQAHLEARVTFVYSEPWYIQDPGIFKTLTYSELWYIQNSGIFRTLPYSKPDPYLEAQYVQNQTHIENTGIFKISSIFTTLSTIYGRKFCENNANSSLHNFSNMANSDLQETGPNKVKLVFNILAYSVITRHIQEVSITAHSETCVNLVYSEPWYIQNRGIFRTMTYLEAWHIQNTGISSTVTYSES